MTDFDNYGDIDAFIDAMPRPELPPCPPWCAREPRDHDLVMDHTGGGMLTHAIHFAGEDGFWVDIDQGTYVHANGSFIVYPVTLLASCEDSVFKAAAARRFAAALLNAADRLQEITGSAS